VKEGLGSKIDANKGGKIARQNRIWRALQALPVSMKTAISAATYGSHTIVY
jgi:hypothetical protein